MMDIVNTGDIFISEERHTTVTSSPVDMDDAELSMSPQSTLERFSVGYQGVHGYLSLTVCSFGIISNALNVIVFTRRSMSNATNCLLTALAITDLLTMIVYVPNACYFYCYTQPDPNYGHGYYWIIYLLFNSAFSITAHTVAVWLTVSIAVFRYIVVCGRHSLGARLCSRQRAQVAVVAVVVTTIVFCIPNYIMYRPVTYDLYAIDHNDSLLADHSNLSVVPGYDETGNGFTSSSWSAVVPAYDDVIAFTDSAANDTSSVAVLLPSYWFEENSYITDRYRIVNFWLFGVVLKVVPCILLTSLSGLLVRAMHMADLRRRRLLNAGRRAESDRAGEHNRTTAMLVAVVLCFVATEMPQGILAFLSGVDDRIFAAVYVPLGDFWDILVLINSAINFIVYCKMNRRFRRTFAECFCRVAGLHRFGIVVSGPEMTTATAAGMSSRPAHTTQQHASVMPLYTVVEPSHYSRT